MRDRLIELLKTPHKAEKLRDHGMAISRYESDTPEAMIADFLLANGVMLPPVSIGQTVWVYNQTTNNIYRNTVIGIQIFGTGKNANKIIVKYVNQRGETSDRKFTWAQIGKQVFLTEEEATNALVERTKNENS